MISKVLTAFFFSLSVATNLAHVTAQENLPIPSTLAHPDTDFIRTYIRATDRLLRSDPDSAVNRYLHAVQMSRSIGYYVATAHCLMKIGAYYFVDNQNYTKSQAFLYKALSYYNKLEREGYWLIPHTYNLLGSTFYYTGQNDSAIFYYDLAMRTMDSLSLSSKWPDLLATIYGNMGMVLASSYQHQQGMHYLKKSIRLTDQISDPKQTTQQQQAVNYINLAGLYARRLNNGDSAIYYWSNAVSLLRKLSMHHLLQDVYAFMAETSSSILFRDVSETERYLDTAIRIDPVSAKQNIRVQSALSSMYYSKADYTRAIQHGKRVLSLIEGTGSRVYIKNAYEILSYCYAYLGDTLNSHQYHRLFIRASDSLLNEEVTQSIGQIEIQYRIAEKNEALAHKDKALAEHEASLYRQRYWLAGTIGGGLMLLMAFVGFARNNRQKRRFQAERIQNLERQRKIDQLQIKMDAEEQERKRIARELHDGLGTLISATKISQKLLAKTVPQAGDTKPFMESHQLLNQMQDEVGVITNNLIPNYITQHGLESALQTLVTRFHLPETFEIQVHSYGPVKELHPDRTFTLYRVVEEILHNAVKHSGGTRLTIQLMYHEEQLHISIEDNGSGFDMEHQYTGMGLQNIRSRVQNLNGHLHLSAKKGKGTSYMLEIPY